MGVLVSPEKQLCIFWSPKSGSSSAVKLFFEYINFEYNKHIWIHDERERYQRLVHPSELPDNYEKYLKIQICRNPYSRAVSSYMHLSQIVERSGDRINIKETLYDLPRMFSYMIKRGTTHFDRNNLHNYVAHSLMPQHMTDNIDELIMIEDFEQSIRNINAKYAINLPISKYLNHSHKIGIQKNTNKYKFIPDRFIKSYSDGLTNYEKEFVKSWFWEDFEFFKYSQ